MVSEDRTLSSYPFGSLQRCSLRDLRPKKSCEWPWSIANRNYSAILATLQITNNNNYL